MRPRVVGPVILKSSERASSVRKKAVVRGRSPDPLTMILVGVSVVHWSSVKPTTQL